MNVGFKSDEIGSLYPLDACPCSYSQSPLLEHIYCLYNQITLL